MKHQLDILLNKPPPGVMGVVNVTPNSFSDGGQFVDIEKAIDHARTLAMNGADILDIGGESTAPDSRPITANQELGRIEGVVTALASAFVLSIDTYRATTAARCLEIGAKMINDTSALRADPNLAFVVREHDAMLIMMHAKDGPLPHATEAPRYYRNLIAEIGDFLAQRIDTALAAGDNHSPPRHHATREAVATVPKTLPSSRARR